MEVRHVSRVPSAQTLIWECVGGHNCTEEVHPPLRSFRFAIIDVEETQRDTSIRDPDPGIPIQRCTGDQPTVTLRVSYRCLGRDVRVLPSVKLFPGLDYSLGRKYFMLFKLLKEGTTPGNTYSVIGVAIWPLSKGAPSARTFDGL